MLTTRTATSGGLWLVVSLSGILTLSDSLIGALRKAHEISGRTASFFDAPSAIVLVGTDERIDAYGIMALWRHLGWST